MTDGTGAAIPKKLYYKIGEACKAVDIQPYVLRYWETEFSLLAPSKSKSGQRVYTGEELELIRRIKELLYDEGYTIAGAKKRLDAELREGRSKGVDGPRLFEVEGSEDDAEEGQDAESPAAAGDEDAAPTLDSAPAASSVDDVDTGLSDRIETLEATIRDVRREIRDLLELMGSTTEEE